MTIFRSERGIGRGETPESQLEVPFFAAVMVLWAVALLVFHLSVGNENLTLALAVSMVIFGVTVLRVELGVYILVIAMLLSPEVTAGPLGWGERWLNVRYNDVLIPVIFLGVLVKQAFEGRAQPWLPSPINAGLVLYYGIAILSTLFALRRSLPAWNRTIAAFVMLKMAEFYMVFFLVGSAIRDMKQVRKQLTLFFVVALTVCGYCLYTVGTFDRVSAPFEYGGTEPNTLGGYLVVVICVAGGLLLYAPTTRARGMCGFLVVAALIPFLFTLSRASYVSLLAALMALAVLGRRSAVALVIMIILCLSPILMPEVVKDRVNYTFQRGSGVPLVIAGYDTGLQVDKSTYERVYVWAKVRYNMRFWPWFGGGVSWDTVLDSQYARVLIETGLLGFAAFVFMQYGIYRTTRDAHRWSRDWVGRGLGLGAGAALVGLIIHALGTITFLIIRIMEPFWFIIALTAVARHNAILEHARRRQALSNQQAAAKPAPEPVGAAADGVSP